MSNDYYPVIETLRHNTSKVLEEFIKAFIEKKDYDSISVMADYGNKAEQFFDNLYSDVIVNTEVVDDVILEPVVEEVTNVKTLESKDLYNEMKLFIFNYIGGRGGKTNISDLAYAFHKQFKHTFTNEDYDVVSGTTMKWQHRMYDQVKTMRGQGLVNPKGKGKDYRTYSLTVAGLRHYKKYASKNEKQLELPDMFGEA